MCTHPHLCARYCGTYALCTPIDANATPTPATPTLFKTSFRQCTWAMAVVASAYTEAATKTGKATCEKRLGTTGCSNVLAVPMPCPFPCLKPSCCCSIVGHTVAMPRIWTGVEAPRSTENSNLAKLDSKHPHGRLHF